MVHPGLRELRDPDRDGRITTAKSVWRALQEIPPGATRSYIDIARELGRPAASRAVARANGANQIALIIPCHRVIGSDGSLTGYRRTPGQCPG
ncbi:MAG: MGMT family protein [Erythrobacter sp.]